MELLPEKYCHEQRSDDNIGTDASGSHPVESFAVGDDVDKHQNTGGDDEHLARMKFFPGDGT